MTVLADEETQVAAVDAPSPDVVAGATDPEPEPEHRLPTARPEVLTWCVMACGAFAYGAWRHRWIHEDGFLNFRIVEQLLLGNGPVFNAGERVEAFTSPAQIAVLALGRIATLGTIPIETVAFTVGIVSAVAGLWCAMLGASRLWGDPPTPGPRWLPLGALVFVATPPAWDYATSGHEGALAYLWLGASLLVLATRLARLREGDEVRVDRSRWALVLLGSGVMVRPEYALYSMAFVVCWCALHRGVPGSRVRAALWAFSLVLVAEVLRMGYFGQLLPNTALAKLGGTDWDRGAGYLVSFARPYLLHLVLLAVAAIAAPVVLRGSKPQRWVVGAFVVPSIAVVVQLAVIGGDYVHGRLLVQPLFAMLAPIALVPRAEVWNGTTGAARTRRAGIVLLCAWAVIAATSLRADAKVRDRNILDPRLDARQVAELWTSSDARRADDYIDSFLVGPYHSFAATKDRSDGNLLWVHGPFGNQAVPLPPTHPSAIASGAVGALGVIAGPDVQMIDRTALADLVAARQPAVQRTPGHLRYLPTAWVYARAGVGNDPESRAALRALGCGRLGELMDSADEPLTPGRFLENLVRAPGNTLLHVPADPQDAVDAFC